MTELTEVQIELIDKIAKENGFVEYEVKTNIGSFKGDNFLGIITTVTLTNGDKKLELMLKSCHKNETFRRAAPIRLSYLREIYVYEIIFKEFKKFQEEQNVADTFDSYANIYGSSNVQDNECLVMENLKTKGYQLWNKQTTMNSEHILAVLKEYAKLHATSMAMKHKNPKLYENLTKTLIHNVWNDDCNSLDEFKEKNGPVIKSIMIPGYEAVEDSDDLTEYVKKVEASLSDIMFTELRKPEYQQVVVHGDCWCNNIMFKYDDELDKKKPSSLKIVDWQISYLNSPAYDVCYFFLIHSPKEILVDYESYLKLYYDSFSKHLKRFNYDSEEVFPYSRFEQHVRICMVYGMYVSFMVLRIMLCDASEAPDFSQIEAENEFFQAMNFKIKNDALYKERLRILIEFLKEQNFLNY